MGLSYKALFLVVFSERPGGRIYAGMYRLVSWIVKSRFTAQIWLKSVESLPIK